MAAAVGKQSVVVVLDVRKKKGLFSKGYEVCTHNATRVIKEDPVALAQKLQDSGVWITGTAGEADKSVYQADMKGPLALVMGAEGQGMRRLTREHCDHLINIPMGGTVSSLNVSVATGVCLFEAVRQRSV